MRELWQRMLQGTSQVHSGSQMQTACLWRCREDNRIEQQLYVIVPLIISYKGCSVLPSSLHLLLPASMQSFDEFHFRRADPFAGSDSSHAASASHPYKGDVRCGPLAHMQPCIFDACKSNPITGGMQQAANYSWQARVVSSTGVGSSL